MKIEIIDSIKPINNLMKIHEAEKPPIIVKFALVIDSSIICQTNGNMKPPGTAINNANSIPNQKKA